MDWEKLRSVICEEISLYWRSYDDIEKSIFSRLKSKGFENCNKVICTGDIENLYIFLVCNDDLIIYNHFNDLNNCYIVKQFLNLNKIEFCDGFLVVPITSEMLNILELPEVILINLCVIENFPVPRLNLSTGAIASYLRKFQCAKVTIIDMQTRVFVNDIIDKCRLTNPAFIGISISFGQRKIADFMLVQFVELIERGIITSKIVIGNVIPSLYRKEFLKEYKEIIVAYQEGEYTFLDLIDYYKGKKTISQVRGITYIENATKNLIENASELVDMASLPFPALDTLSDIVKYKGALTLECSRGCNYAKCTFCPRFHKTSCWRCLPSKRTIEHFAIMADVAEKNNLSPTIFLADEEFVGQLPEKLEIKRINELCEYLKLLNKKIEFEISARIDSIYDPSKSHDDNINKLKMWKSLHDNGLKRLFLGVESGCNRQLKRFAKGTTSIQNVVAIRLISALGINIRIGYITFDPLMDSFDDLIENIEFLEREDILLNVISHLELEQLYYSIINYDCVATHNCVKAPLYTKVSYMLTTLEVLAGSAYSKMMELEEKKLKVNLLIDIDVNMARYKVGFVNDIIGALSEYCQKWIDSNFSLLYTIKSLYKVAFAEEKRLLYEYMIESRKLSHYLIKYMLYSLDIYDYVDSLVLFFDEYEKKFIKQQGNMEDILMSCLNLWHSFMEVFVYRIINDVKNFNIKDTIDGILIKSIDNWVDKAGNWYLIN